MLKHKKRGKTIRRLTALLVISISLFTFQKILYAEMFDQSAEHYRIKGYEEQQKGNLDKALTYYTKAVALKSDSPIVCNDLGVIYELLGVYDKAEQYYLKSIQYNREYLPPYTNLAFLYQKRGQLKKAIIYFEKRIKRAPAGDPWIPKIHQELQKLNPKKEEELKKNKIKEEAEKLSLELINKAREEFQLEVVRAEKHYQKGQTYLEENNYEEAIQEFDRALTVTPLNPKILKARKQAVLADQIMNIKRRTTNAIEKLDLGDLESAKKEFQEILSIIPNESIQETE